MPLFSWHQQEAARVRFWSPGSGGRVWWRRPPLALPLPRNASLPPAPPPALLSASLVSTSSWGSHSSIINEARRPPCLCHFLPGWRKRSSQHHDHNTQCRSCSCSGAHFQTSNTPRRHDKRDLCRLRRQSPARPACSPQQRTYQCAAKGVISGNGEPPRRLACRLFSAPAQKVPRSALPRLLFPPECLTQGWQACGFLRTCHLVQPPPLELEEGDHRHPLTSSDGTSIPRISLDLSYKETSIKEHGGSLPSPRFESSIDLGRTRGPDLLISQQTLKRSGLVLFSLTNDLPLLAFCTLIGCCWSSLFPIHAT